MGLDQLARPLAYPLSATSDQDLYFDFTDPATFGRGWTVPPGYGAPPTITGGAIVAASGTENVIVRTSERPTDSEIIARVTLTNPIGAGTSWMFIHRYLGSEEYLLTRFDPVTPSLTVFKKDTTFTTFTAPTVAALTAGATYWLRSTAIGNVVSLEVWDDNPAKGGSPSRSATWTLTGGDATKFGAGVRGLCGLRHNSAALHTLDDLTIRPLGRPPRQRDVQVFTTSGTWTKPAGAAADPNATTRIIVQGAGGGGGSGARRASGTASSGGAGGQGGGTSTLTIPTSGCLASGAITVAAGGAGGAAVTTNDTNGNPGVAATDTRAAILAAGSGVVIARGAGMTAAGGGVAGGASSGGGGGVAMDSGPVGGSGVNGGQGGGGGLVSTGAAAGGGGAGGGISAAPAAFAGGASSFHGPADAVTAGGAIGTNGTSDAGALALHPGYAGAQGGTGGGSSISGVGGNGGRGGNGTTTFGGGGGGGGSSLNGNNSGAGGAGGPGIVIVITEWGG